MLRHYADRAFAALLGAEEQIERVGGHLQQSIAALYGPVQNLVDVTSQAFPREIEGAEQERRAEQEAKQQKAEPERKTKRHEAADRHTKYGRQELHVAVRRT